MSASTPEDWESGQTGLSRAVLAYLVLTTVICGALVMVVEVLGSRVIGPFFGVSLFVWTSLITVTLLALAGGYAVGGAIADRRSSPDYLYGLVLAAGLLVFLIPYVKGPVLKLCMPLGLRAGSFASTLLLFGPALFLLGCVSPYIVRLAARRRATLGRVVGGLYALSTFGSVAGTVLTGFVLIALLGVDEIFQLIGLLLIALASGYFLVLRRRWGMMLALVVPLLLPQPPATVEKVMEDGTRVIPVAAEDSHYGNLKVVDYQYGGMRTRELMIDGLIQGGIDVRNGMSIYEYSYFLEFIPYVLNPSGKTCLVIGLGVGVVPRWYQRHGIRTDVVDIDPSVIELAREHFGFTGKAGRVIVSDARYFLATAKEKYDYVILDVFSGDTTPTHLLSVEALALLEARLVRGGVLAVNLVGSLRRNTLMTASVVKTLKRSFDNVVIYPTFVDNGGAGSGNLALIAYQGPARVFRPEAASGFPVHPMASAGVRQGLASPFEFPADTPAMVLTDNYNPVDFYDAWLREKVRREIVHNTDWDVLIGSF